MYKGHRGQTSASKKDTNYNLFKCLILFVQSQKTFPPNINDSGKKKKQQLKLDILSRVTKG